MPNCRRGRADRARPDAQQHAPDAAISIAAGALSPGVAPGPSRIAHEARSGRISGSVARPFSDTAHRHAPRASHRRGRGRRRTSAPDDMVRPAALWTPGHDGACGLGRRSGCPELLRRGRQCANAVATFQSDGAGRPAARRGAAAVAVQRGGAARTARQTRRSSSERPEASDRVLPGAKVRSRIVMKRPRPAHAARSTARAFDPMLAEAEDVAAASNTHDPGSASMPVSSPQPRRAACSNDSPGCRPPPGVIQSRCTSRRSSSQRNSSTRSRASIHQCRDRGSVLPDEGLSDELATGFFAEAGIKLHKVGG